MVKKSKGALEDQREAKAAGHNSEKLLKDYVTKDIEIVKKIQSLNDQRKLNLNDAKDAGFLKTSIRRTTQNLLKSEEQRQADREVDAATAHYTKMCIDLPLFDNAEKEAA